MDNRNLKPVLTAIIGLVMTAPVASAQTQNFPSAEQAPAPRAIQCSAALELMARAAPRWSNQAVAQQARYFWRVEAEQLASSVGRNANTEIGQEMGLLAEQAVSNPDALSNQATQCLGDVPTAGSVTQNSTQQNLAQQNSTQQTSAQQNSVEEPATSQSPKRRRLFRRN